MEIFVRFSARSLGKTCFRCIAHVGQECASNLELEPTHPVKVRLLRVKNTCTFLSCVHHKRTKTGSPKNLRGGRPSHTCTKLSTNMFNAIQTSYQVHVSVIDMFCMCYSTFSLGHNAFEKSRLRKTHDLTNQAHSRDGRKCSGVTNVSSFNVHCVLVSIVS